MGSGGECPRGLAGRLTHLGRVLRCFAWFRDFVDPWRMRNRAETSLWMHLFQSSPSEVPQTVASRKPGLLLQELPSALPALAPGTPYQVFYAPDWGGVSPLEGGGGAGNGRGQGRARTSTAPGVGGRVSVPSLGTGL